MNKQTKLIVIAIVIGIILTFFSSLIRTKSTYLDHSKLCASIGTGVESRTAYGFPLTYYKSDIDEGGCGSQHQWVASAFIVDAALYSLLAATILYIFTRKKK